MKTPAEQLAAKKKPRRKRPPLKPTWVCILREVRKSMGLSLRDVSDNVGLSVSSLWIIEHGGEPVLSNAYKIAAFFGKEIKELWPKLHPEFSS